MQGIFESVKDNQLCIPIHHIIHQMHILLFDCMEEASWRKEAIWFKFKTQCNMFKLLFESFWNIFYNASVLKNKKTSPFNNCKDVKALLSAFKDEFRNSFFFDVHEIL